MKTYFVKLMFMTFLFIGMLSACSGEVGSIGAADVAHVPEASTDASTENDSTPEHDSSTENDSNSKTNTLTDTTDNADILALSVEEQQKINDITARYLSIQTFFPGGYFITTPTTTPQYHLGEVRNEVLQAGVEAINLVRYIAGVPDDVELSAEYTELSQHGAVLLTAINELTHSPRRPANMDEAFYNRGYRGASRSNISTANLPFATIFQYMRDDSSPSNIESVGHRRWILNPPMKYSGFGVGAQRYGLMYAFDRSRGNVDYDYIAWPSPGVFPTNFMSLNLPWSISVNAQKYGRPDAQNIEVTLKHLNSERVWTFSSDTPSSTAPFSAFFNVDNGGYGINNCIIFRPALDNSFKFEEGDVFEVILSGLDNELSYIIKMFSI